MSFPVPTLSVAPARRDAASIWKQIEHGVREACVMRCEGREREAAALLQETLPPLVRAWSTTCGASAEACRNQLRDLIAKAQEQVAAAMLSRRLVLASLGTDDAPAPVRARPNTHSSFSLRRRIPIDNVPEMLDALQESERAAASAFHRQNFPTHASQPLAALAAV